MPASLRRNLTGIVAGNAVYALCQWGMLAVLIHRGGAEVGGEYALGLAITSPVMLLVSFGLRQAQSSDVADRYSFRDYLRLRSLLSVVGLTGLVGVTAIVADAESTAVIAAMALTKVVFAIGETYAGLFHRHERLDIVGQSLILRGVLGLLALAATYARTGSLTRALLAVAAAWLFVVVVHDISRARPFARTGLACSDHTSSSLLALAKSSFPLGIASMLQSLSANVPRYLVEGLLGTTALGVFAAVSYPITAVQIFMNAVHQTFVPRLARAFETADAAAANRITIWMHTSAAVVGLMGVVASVAIGGWALALLYGPEFAEHRNLLVVLALAGLAGFIASSFNHIVLARRSFWIQPVAHATAIVASLATGVFLVLEYGAIGAGIAWAAAFAAQAIVLALAGGGRRTPRDE